MASHSPLRDRLFRAKKRVPKCTAETCMKLFEQDKANVKLPRNGTVIMNWKPADKKVEYIMFNDGSRRLEREFAGITSEMMVDFLKELRGRHPELRILNTLIL